ncbi:MAG: hypothetical protein QM774_04000 [Gordonia sp. (in: high G+C Gram-positive bacteria)]|uniref:hypothetical protein n=1 Tax=Gordonia sp. (in: high G+C Gram-positive bacteria) TaxID=84139 RepID=UPI0039E3873A
MPPAASYGQYPGAQVPPGAQIPPGAQYAQAPYAQYPGAQIPPGAYPYPPAAMAGGPYPRQATGTVDVGTSVSWSWKAFTRNPVGMMLPGILQFVAGLIGAGVIIAGVFLMLRGTTTTTAGYDSATGTYSNSSTDFQFHPDGLILILLGLVALIALTSYLQGGLQSGILAFADGRPVSTGTFLKPSRPGAYVGTVLLVTLVTIVGFVLIVPGILAMFAFQYAPIMVLDKNLSPVQAMKASAKLAFGKFGDSIIVTIVHWAYNWVGGMVLIGTILTMPLAEAFRIHAYRDLESHPIPQLP